MKRNIVRCEHSGRVHRCPSDTCSPVGRVQIYQKYSSDCYQTGQPSADGQTFSQKWYRIYLPNKAKGFVNSFFCEGVKIPRCKR
ncbi:unnamed protein product [Adineta ricciae]|uniref:Uncharacterized protein n=1 Tax=Adineta ricciae TaxID=249248 RepID=A0A815LWN8_ADIRI|nr:unnamed protein product [Adineta ricciae]CAF1653428.1 unnamed protein product [Adineta ricciae]